MDKLHCWQANFAERCPPQNHMKVGKHVGLQLLHVDTELLHQSHHELDFCS